MNPGLVWLTLAAAACWSANRYLISHRAAYLVGCFLLLIAAIVAGMLAVTGT